MTSDRVRAIMKANSETESTPAGHLYETVAQRITSLIERGTLRSGERIPSVRKMSRQQQVSIATAIQAYRLLENRGLIEARPQSGYYVRPRVWAAPPEPSKSQPARRSTTVSNGELTMRVQRGADDRGNVVNLGTAPPSPELVPARQLLRSLASAGRQCLGQMARCEPSAGSLAFRTQVARRAMDAGCVLSPDDIVATVGCQEALYLCLRAATKPGDTIAVESPAYFGVLQLVETLGLRVCEIPTYPREGICLDELVKSLDCCRVKACLFTPNFSNPLGSLMPDDKKARMVEILADRNIPLIEDDVFGDLNFTVDRPKTAKAYDRKGLVLLCSSFSKTLAPSYRAGWCAPGKFLERITYLKYVTNLSSPSLPQLAVADFLANGGYDHHLRRIRRAYAEQVRRCSETIAKQFPAETKITRPQGGYLLWLELPKGVDAIELFERAAREKITIAPGPIFSPSGRYRNFIRLSCGNPWTEALERALVRLGHLVERMSQGN